MRAAHGPDRPTWIYAIRVSGVIRYVGQTVNRAVRMAFHRQTYGAEAAMETLDLTTSLCADARERHWVQHFLDRGVALDNASLQYPFPSAGIHPEWEQPLPPMDSEREGAIRGALPRRAPGREFIYALRDPDTGLAVRVSAAVDLRGRWRHCLAAGQPVVWSATTQNRWFAWWAQRLLRAGKLPIVDVLEETAAENALERLRFWIEALRSEEAEHWKRMRSENQSQQRLAGQGDTSSPAE